MVRAMRTPRVDLARSGAKPGDIFTPEIAAQFKRIIRPESREHGTKEAIKAQLAGVAAWVAQDVTLPNNADSY
jgi:hypothetical protein